MQDIEKTRPPVDIDEEIAKIKSKLNLNFTKENESPLDLSKISDNHEGNNTYSLISSTLNDLKIIEMNKKLTNLADLEKPSLDLKLLKPDAFEFHMREEAYVKEIQELQARVNQYEVDLQYCINQNTLAFEEIKELQYVLHEKDQIIETMRSEGPSPLIGSPRNMKYKIYSELDLIKAENARLIKEIAKLNDRNNITDCKYREAEFKYNELLYEVTSFRKNSYMLIENLNPATDNAMKRIDQASLEFQRKIMANMEKENKELAGENEFLRLKVAELESINQKNAENAYVKELLNVLGLNNEKELYKKVLCLGEIAKQGKEQRQLVQKLAKIISQKTGKTQISPKDISNYISANLR